MLLKQNEENKVSTRFYPVPYQVANREGNSVIVELPQGTEYQHKVTQAKKYITSDKHSLDLANSDELEQPAKTNCDVQDEPPLPDGGAVSTCAYSKDAEAIPR